MKTNTETAGQRAVRHTPGPWRIFDDRTDDHQFTIAQRRSGPITLGVVCHVRDIADAAPANAALIAAAPDLLAVCLEIQEHHTDDWDARMKTLDAAISKALGS